MPYTANFSERFYEKLGHDVVTELIDLVNHMDLAYRTELRDQNEANFQKFEAVLRAEMAALGAQFETKLARFETKLAGLEGRMDVGFASLRGEMADLRAELAVGQATMLRWMVFLFLGAVLTVVGLG